MSDEQLRIMRSLLLKKEFEHLKHAFSRIDGVIFNLYFQYCCYKKTDATKASAWKPDVDALCTWQDATTQYVGATARRVKFKSWQVEPLISQVDVLIRQFISKHKSDLHEKTQNNITECMESYVKAARKFIETVKRKLK